MGATQRHRSLELCQRRFSVEILHVVLRLRIVQVGFCRCLLRQAASQSHDFVLDLSTPSQICSEPYNNIVQFMSPGKWYFNFSANPVLAQASPTFIATVRIVLDCMRFVLSSCS